MTFMPSDAHTRTLTPVKLPEQKHWEPPMPVPSVETVLSRYIYFTPSIQFYLSQLHSRVSHGAGSPYRKALKYFMFPPIPATWPPLIMHEQRDGTRATSTATPKGKHRDTVQSGKHSISQKEFLPPLPSELVFISRTAISDVTRD
jgi:hypothetical protein